MTKYVKVAVTIQYNIIRVVKPYRYNRHGMPGLPALAALMHSIARQKPKDLKRWDGDITRHLVPMTRITNIDLIPLLLLISTYKTSSVAARFGRHGTPPPASNPNLWPFDLETDMRVASKVGNFPSKFGHAWSLGFRIIRYVRDGRTDKHTVGRTKATLITPLPYGWGHTNWLAIARTTTVKNSNRPTTNVLVRAIAAATLKIQRRDTLQAILQCLEKRVARKYKTYPCNIQRTKRREKEFKNVQWNEKKTKSGK